jgi:gluconate 2-dehydrogenase gamma chain
MAQRSSHEREGFFNPEQRRTIEAAMARIIPTDDQPGAREACTVDFVDQYLAGANYVYAKPDGSGFEQLMGKRAEAWQRRITVIRQKYLAGIEDLNQRSDTRFGLAFANLEDDQQDLILLAMERPSLEEEEQLDLSQVSAGFAPVEPAMQQTSVEVDLDFFPLLALHTRQGFYSDPVYGGNKGRVGWRLIGFDGPTSMAETHAGRYTTLPYFADEPINWRGESEHDNQG